MEGPQELDRSDMEWILYRTASDVLVLSVLCGTVAMYSIDIALTPSERREYERDGRRFIDVLAGRVVSDPKGYGERHLQQW